MKPKTLILMVLAVVCGLAASYMTSRLLAERDASQAEEEKVTVLVAKQKIIFGTLIKEPEKFFVEKSFRKGDEPKKAIREFSQLKDRRLNKPLAEEQFVTLDDLVDKNQAGLDGLLSSGMRAVALKVNAESTVGGFVLPNCHVDIVSTVHRGPKDTYSQIILQNVLVLAADMQYQRDPERPAMLASTVTVAAKPEDAQKLRMAAAMGELSLILRSPEDSKIVNSKPVRPDDVLKGAPHGSDPAADEGGEAHTPVWGGKLPDVPAGPAKPGEKVADGKPQPVVAPPKTITQLIYNGESLTKSVYVQSNNGETTTQIEKTVSDRSEKKPLVGSDKPNGNPAPAKPAEVGDVPSPKN